MEILGIEIKEMNSEEFLKNSNIWLSNIVLAVLENGEKKTIFVQGYQNSISRDEQIKNISGVKTFLFPTEEQIKQLLDKAIN